MTKIEAVEIIGGNLSKASKMPCGSFSLSAFDCVTGSKLAKVKGSICNKCYARRGNYLFPSYRKSSIKKINSINNKNWAKAIIKLIRIQALENDTNYFRWFDSGDLQKGMLKNIFEVCRATPEITHWLPTHESKMINDEIVKLGEEVPSNLIIRLSAPMVDGSPPKSWTYTSTVHKLKPSIGFECPAKYQDNKCLDCRACWDKDIKNISYSYH
jgi:hypothetical protein